MSTSYMNNRKYEEIYDRQYIERLLIVHTKKRAAEVLGITERHMQRVCNVLKIDRRKYKPRKMGAGNEQKNCT